MTYLLYLLIYLFNNKSLCWLDRWISYLQLWPQSGMRTCFLETCYSIINHLVEMISGSMISVIHNTCPFQTVIEFFLFYSLKLEFCKFLKVFQLYLIYSWKLSSRTKNLPVNVIVNLNVIEQQPMIQFHWHVGPFLHLL